MANLGKVGFIIDPKETGIKDLVAWGQAPEPSFIDVARSWPKLLSLVDKASQRGIDHLGVDSITGLQQLCFAYHCKEHFNNDWSKEDGFYSYYAGPAQAAQTDWAEFLDHLTELNHAGVSVHLIGHSKTKTKKNPEGNDYLSYEPTCDERIWEVTHAWAQAVLFINYRIRTKTKGGKNKIDIEESEGRVMQTTYTPVGLAKNRYGLDPFIDMGETGAEAAANFLEALKAAHP